MTFSWQPETSIQLQTMAINDLKLLSPVPVLPIHADGVRRRRRRRRAAPARARRGRAEAKTRTARKCGARTISGAVRGWRRRRRRHALNQARCGRSGVAAGIGGGDSSAGVANQYRILTDCMQCRSLYQSAVIWLACNVL